jgi:hypothetical protein
VIPFNSIKASQAVTEFIPCRRQKFKALNAAKEIIAALRQKGASHPFVSEWFCVHEVSAIMDTNTARPWPWIGRDRELATDMNWPRPVRKRHTAISMNEATAADLTEGKSEVVCEAGKLMNSAA